jgi:hypothetical protein
LFKKAINLLDSGPLHYYLEKLTECREEFFKRCSPFRVGDTVEMVKTPNIDEKSGWWGSRHFLVAGSSATVKSIDFRKGKFMFDVCFTDESWIGMDGKVTPMKPENRHTFCFSESYFRRV